ncbi:MAG: NAD(P)/FAD-dependent oxidoreductase [Clostridiales bacterium]|jgi:thioredoxin reductase (NADPH)|nr:NAD(P)/FAD-dependent oxidoreductase [Clostridiales bacterium]
MYDIAVVGAGPSGLSAAINAQARGRSVIVFGRDKTTNFLYKAEKVNNYLGMPGLSGEAMTNSFHKHALDLGIEIKIGRVMQIMPMGDYFAVNFDNDIYEARAIILATGITKSDKIKGEDDFLGRGVSYCATCDGMLYRNKDVAVVGRIEEADDDVAFLSKVCSHVYYFKAHDNDREFGENVTILKGKVKEVIGGDFVSAIKTDNGDIECKGVFFVKGAVPADSIIAGIKLNGAAIEVDRFMRTSVDGVFAAGDATGWPFQIANAVGEGLIAAQQADRYLK